MRLQTGVFSSIANMKSICLSRFGTAESAFSTRGVLDFENFQSMFHIRCQLRILYESGCHVCVCYKVSKDIMVERCVLESVGRTLLQIVVSRLIVLDRLNLASQDQNLIHVFDFCFVSIHQKLFQRTAETCICSWLETK